MTTEIEDNRAGYAPSTQLADSGLVFENEQQLARTLARLIEEDDAVGRAVIRAALSCPNIVRQH